MKIHDSTLGLNVANTDQGQFVTSESHATPRAKPGEIITVLSPEGERRFRYMKAEEAFAIGQVGMIAALIDNADVDQAQATTTAILKGTGDFTANDFGSSVGAKWPDAYTSIDVNTGAGQTRHIKYNRGSTDYLTLDKNWDTALDTTSDYVTYSVNYISLSDTDDVSARASQPRGVAISAIADEEWGWFQIYGFCPLVRCEGATDPAIRGALITPSSTAGAVKGPTAAGTTADDVAVNIGHAMHAYAVADGAGKGVAAFLNIA